MVLSLSLVKDELPNEYRRSIISFLKKSLELYNNGKFFDHFYKGNNKKSFSFGAVLPNPQFINDTIKLEKPNFKLIISINNSKEGFILFNSLMGMKDVKFNIKNQNSMILKKIEVKNEVEIKDTTAIFSIVSPLCIRSHNKETNKDYYYSIENDQFINQFKIAVKVQVDNNLKPYVDKMQVVPINCKKTIVKHYGQYIETTIGQIAINANPLLLNYLYKSGACSRSSQGFGLLDVVRGVSNEEYTKG